MPRPRPSSQTGDEGLRSGTTTVQNWTEGQTLYRLHASRSIYTIVDRDITHFYILSYAILPHACT